MGVVAGLYMCDVVKKFTFAISSPDEFLSVSERVVNVWNNLPASVDSKSLSSFKRTVKLVDLSKFLKCF